MFTGSIKISELDALLAVVAADFFPLVQSGSMTTFRVDIATLNNWFRISGSCLSASWASASLTSLQSISSSWASASSTALQSISSSWASASISSSYALSSSAALVAITSSFALQATSASFAPFTQSVQASASWASASLSSSYALSASYAPALADTLPIGSIIALGTSTIPNNYLECNGDAKSTSSFSELYTAIQTTDLTASFGYLCDSFGNRDTSGSFFKIPDLRGEFIRGWDNSRGIDSGRTMASLQTSSVQSHGHRAYVGGSDGSTSTIKAGFQTIEDGHNGVSLTYLNANPTNPFIETTGINETRPRNIAIVYCIKYSNVTNFATTGITLAGDVVGTSSATNVVAIQGIPVTSSAPSDGQVLQYESGAGKWVPSTPQSNGVVAWATILIPTASNYSSDNPATVANGNSINKPIIWNGSNVSDVSWTAQTITFDTNFMSGRPITRTDNASLRNLLVTLSTTASSTNYMLVGDCFEQGTEYGSITLYPFQTRTTTQFTMSFGGGPDFSGGSEYIWITFLLYA